MDQRLSLITIGVNDLAAVRAFYEEKFEWTPVAANKDIVFFLMNGFLLGFFGKEDLAKDANVTDLAHGATPFTLAYNVASESEVDSLVASLESRGVRIVKRPEATFFGGYNAYVADVEENLWEIACNPFVELDHAGNVVTHKDISTLE
ncbi:MAG: hypothetical protein JWQ02_4372 [Capsulimonas sp.]|nr:hypothetical protein [Capsulimonas sp.]